MDRFLFVLLIAFSISGSAEAAPENTIRLESMADSCLKSSQQDEICQSLIQLRQMGYDSVEAIKQYANLSQNQYTLLTIANAIATKKIRLRSKSYFLKDGYDILDIRKDSASLGLEVKF